MDRRRGRALVDMKFTRRQFLTYQAVMNTGGVGFFEAQEAVASTALEHPEWDMDEEYTWAEWMAHEAGDKAERGLS